MFVLPETVSFSIFAGVLIWAFIATFIALIATGAIPTPLFDKGSFVLHCPDELRYRQVIQGLKAIGLFPSHFLGERGITRAMYDMGRVIVNYTDPGLAGELGEASAIAFVVDEPTLKANTFAREIIACGGKATVYDAVTLKLHRHDGMLVFVKVEGINSAVFIFRRPFMKMGPPPPKWDWKEHNLLK